MSNNTIYKYYYKYMAGELSCKSKEAKENERG